MVRKEFKAGAVKEIADASARGEIVFTSEGRYLVSVADFSPQATTENSNKMSLAHAG